MVKKSRMEKKANYYIQKLHISKGKNNYFVLECKSDRAVMMFEQDHYKTLTKKGWRKQEHKDFIKIELAENRKDVLVYYKNIQQPIKISIPGVSPDVLKLKQEHIDKAIRQMKEKDLSYDDFWEEYHNGTNTTYSYDKKKEYYIVTTIDVIAASFFNVDKISVDELKSRLMQCASLHELREQGFDV